MNTRPIAALLVVLLLFALPVCAANRYVRASASGAHDGSNWTNAYPALPATFVRGDTYYVADGAYSGSVVFSTAATGTTYIRIRKATASDHGTDVGWSAAYGDGVAAFDGPWVFTTSYWEVDGAVGGGPGRSPAEWPSSWSAGHGILQSVGSGVSNINLNSSQGVVGLRFRHLKLINGTPVNNTTATYANVFHAEYGPSPSASDVVVEYVYIPDFQGVPFHVKDAHDWLIQYSYFEGNGLGNGANHRELWSGIGNDRWTWRWNYIQNQVNTAVWALVNGGGITDSVEIYGNIVSYSPARGESAGMLIDASDTGAEPVTPNNWKLFNNTIVGWINGAPIVSLSEGSNTYWRNNIVANAVTTWGPFITVVNRSHNAIYNITRDGVPPSDVMATYATLNGSDVQLFSGDPFVNYGARDLRLRAPTNPGTSNGSPAANAVDMFGAVRGADGVWDRGALEFLGGSSDTMPPGPPENFRRSTP